MFGLRLIWLGVAAMFLLSACAGKQTEVELAPEEQREGKYAAISITIIYDNNRYDSRLTPAWGFSCMVKSPQKAILFDTGGDGIALLYNMAKLGIAPEEIGIVVLSHAHGDHVGGLTSFLKSNSNVTVYMPTSFPQELKDEVRVTGAKLKGVDMARELFNGAFTTGDLDGGIKEQSLVLSTPNGLVVITGCAHPGVVNIVRKAKDMMAERPVYLVIGGFHLAGAATPQIESVIEGFRQLGVRKIAPCHCSGDETRKVFSEEYGDNYIDSGAGKIINLLKAV